MEALVFHSRDMTLNCLQKSNLANPVLEQSGPPFQLQEFPEQLLMKAGGVILDRAALTSPRELQTTTPIPATPKSSETAPNKFVFKVLGSGGFQIVFFGGLFYTRLSLVLLKFLEVLVYRVQKFCQRSYCLIYPAFLTSMLDGPAYHNKQF